MEEKLYTCICGKVFKSQKSLSAHMASCKEYYLLRDNNLDNYYKRKNNIKINVDKVRPQISQTRRNKTKEIKKQKLDIWINEQHKCECCEKIMTKYYGSGRFCSKECANTRHHSQETKDKISNSTKQTAILHPKYKLKICKNCNKMFWGYTKDKYCSKNCQQQYNMYIQLKKSYSKSIEDLYFKQCNFKFNLFDYKDMFDIELLNKYGMYSAANRGNNINGVDRDHKYSKKNGYKNHIDPYYISHPCNCQLLLHKNNLNKKTKNSISFEDLLIEIEKFNIIYGEYPNTIDYTGFYFL